MSAIGYKRLSAHVTNSVRYRVLSRPILGLIVTTAYDPKRTSSLGTHRSKYHWPIPSMGSCTVKVVPSPSWLSTPISPPCSSTNSLHTLRPIPVP